MERAVVHDSATGSPTYQDGLGERRQIVNPKDGKTVDLLVIRPELTAIPAFLPALRERVRGLAGFRHPDYAQVRRVLRLSEGEGTVGVISEHVEGIRLSDVLARPPARDATKHVGVVLGFIRQLVSSVAALHETSSDVAHGALGPERLLRTPQGRLVVTEYVLGPALERLRYREERYWNDLQIALPVSVGPLPHFDQRTDVTQLGVVALSLILGRVLRVDEYPSRLRDLVVSAWAVSPRAGFEPWPAGLRTWLGRALQLDARNPFANAVDARASLDEMLVGDEVIDPTADPETLRGVDASDGVQAEAAGVGRAPGPNPSVPFVSAPVGAARSVLTSEPPPMPVARADELTDGALFLAAFDSEEPGSSTMAPMVRAITAERARPFFAETLELFPSETPYSFRADGAGAERRDSRELFGDVLAVGDHSWSGVAMCAVGLVVLVAVGVPTSHWLLEPPVSPVLTGTLVIVTNPPGAAAVIDGTPDGTTPLSRKVSAGSHTVELRGEGPSRTIAVAISAGERAFQYIELPGAASEVGHLNVRTDPPGASVTIDGVARGTTPTVADLSPGEHTVLLASDRGWVTRAVSIEPGVIASLVVSATSWSVVAP